MKTCAFITPTLGRRKGLETGRMLVMAGRVSGSAPGLGRDSVSKDSRAEWQSRTKQHTHIHTHTYIHAHLHTVIHTLTHSHAYAQSHTQR